jgi:hypothetical protein
MSIHPRNRVNSRERPLLYGLGRSRQPPIRLSCRGPK